MVGEDWKSEEAIYNKKSGVGRGKRENMFVIYWKNSEIDVFVILEIFGNFWTWNGFFLEFQNFWKHFRTFFQNFCLNNILIRQIHFLFFLIRVLILKNTTKFCIKITLKFAEKYQVVSVWSLNVVQVEKLETSISDSFSTLIQLVFFKFSKTFSCKKQTRCLKKLIIIPKV